MGTVTSERVLGVVALVERAVVRAKFCVKHTNEGRSFLIVRLSNVSNASHCPTKAPHELTKRKSLRLRAKD